MLAAGYYGLSLLMAILIILGYREALKRSKLLPEDQASRFKKLVLIMVLIGGYLAILSVSSALHDFSFPPRFMFFLLIPFIAGSIYFYRTQKDNEVLQAMPKSWTAYYQTCRIAVEILLLYTFYQGIIPESATFEGLNFDVVMGILAPFVGYFVFSDVVKNRKLAILWNVLGIAMIAFVASIIATSTYLPEVWGSEVALVKPVFFSFPYLLIPGFLAPAAIFVHVVSLVQLRQ